MKLLKQMVFTTSIFVFMVGGVLLLTNCSYIRVGGQQHVEQVFNGPEKPVMWNWVKDNSACLSDRRALPWGACTICRELDASRVCTTYSQVSPEQLGPDAGWDEALHALGRVHIGGLPEKGK